MAAYFTNITLIILLLMVYPLFLIQTVNYKRELGRRLRILSGKDVYKKKSNYLNKSEYTLYKLLQEKLSSNYIVIPQANLLSFIDVDNKFENLYEEINTLRHFRVDFLILAKKTTEPMLVVELDGKSHEIYGKKNRDHYVDQVLENAELRIEHIKVGEKFSSIVNEIENILKA